jgi:hypothetical protein
MSDKYPQDFFTVGPFAEARASSGEVGSALYFSYLFMQSMKRRQELQQEYERASEINDEAEMAATKLQLNIHESALELTATILEAPDDLAS